MEPRREETPNAPGPEAGEPRARQKQRRFRVVKLEERVAPKAPWQLNSAGNNGGHHLCACGCDGSAYCLP